MKYYNNLDLPPIPPELLKFDFDDTEMCTPIAKFDKFDYNVDSYINGVYVKPPSYYVYGINPELSPLKQWINENIPYKTSNIIYHITMTHSNHGQMILHTDRGRKVGLNYVIEPGGDEVTTNWYQEKGMPIIREPASGYDQTAEGFVKYDNVELLDSTVFKKNSWCSIRTNVLHDVTNIDSARLLLSIGLADTSCFKD